jgi:hypothetical protein
LFLAGLETEGDGLRHGVDAGAGACYGDAADVDEHQKSSHDTSDIYYNS